MLGQEYGMLDEGSSELPLETAVVLPCIISYDDESRYEAN